MRASQPQVFDGATLPGVGAVGFSGSYCGGFISWWPTRLAPGASRPERAMSAGLHG